MSNMTGEYFFSFNWGNYFSMFINKIFTLDCSHYKQFSKAVLFLESLALQWLDTFIKVDLILFLLDLNKG